MPGRSTTSACPAPTCRRNCRSSIRCMDYSYNVRPADLRRRARLQVQPDEPEPLEGRFRSGQPQTRSICGSVHIRRRPIRRGQGSGELSAARHSRRTTRGSPPTRMWRRKHRRSASARCWHAFRVGAGRRGRDFDHHGSRASRTTSRPATARCSAACRRPASNTAIPFISAHSWGTQTIEPIAQVIVRPDETGIGQFPNEDAQSLIFSDANLLSARQVLRLGSRRGRHARQRRRAIHRPVQRRRLRQRPGRTIVSAVRQELVRGPRHGQHRARQRARNAARPTTWRG